MSLIRSAQFVVLSVVLAILQMIAPLAVYGGICAPPSETESPRSICCCCRGDEASSVNGAAGGQRACCQSHRTGPQTASRQLACACGASRPLPATPQQPTEPVNVKIMAATAATVGNEIPRSAAQRGDARIEAAAFGAVAPRFAQRELCVWLT